MSLRCPERQQKGATLVTALVVVLLVTALATRMGSDYLLLFRTVENQGELQQARVYLRAAESVARQGLLRDLAFDSGVDSYLEPWGGMHEFPLPQGSLRACIADLQGLLNLNDLGAPAGAYSSAQLRFIRLLQALPLDRPLGAEEARSLAHAVFDWVDMDDQARYPGGAESLDYATLDPPYRPANRAFSSVTELRLVLGMTEELVAALTPQVSVWGNGEINFNTLDAGLAWSAEPAANDPQAMLLRTLNDAESLLPLSPDAARRLAALRSNQGGYVSDLEGFRQGEFALLDWDLEGIGLRSEYFRLNADMAIGGRHYRLHSVLQRAVSSTGVPQVTVLARDYEQGAMNEEADCAPALR